MNNIPYLSRISFKEWDYNNKKNSDNETIGGFVAFGVEYEELNNGTGTYSTIILLMDDGKFKNAGITPRYVPVADNDALLPQKAFIGADDVCVVI